MADTQGTDGVLGSRLGASKTWRHTRDTYLATAEGRGGSSSGLRSHSELTPGDSVQNSKVVSTTAYGGKNFMRAARLELHI